MLPFMVFSLMFGFGLSLVSRRAEGSGTLVAILEQVFAVCMHIVDFAMRLAPFAVFAIIFNTAFRFGYEVFASLFFYVATVVTGLLIQQFVVYSLLLRTVAGRSPLQFFSACREVYLYAFSTASSNATLPLALDTADEKLKLPPNIARFVLTVGSTANQNGTALFEGITVLFLAQVYGVNLTTAQQMQVMVMSIVAGIGTAGVPGGSLPLVMIVVQSVGIPVEGMGLILGVDRFLDMCRTTVNVSGDLVIAALVSGRHKSSGQQAVSSRQSAVGSR
jgi:DAACS family dicarboxylate/amino acid:cation (Na+ or H+) symporter